MAILVAMALTVLASTTAAPRVAAVVSVPPLVIDAPSTPVAPGGTYVARVLLTSQYTAAIRFRISGLPLGSSAQLVTVTSRERRLRIQIPSGAPAGIYDVRFRTTNAGRVRTDGFIVSVAAAPAPPTTVPAPPTPPAPPPAVQRPDFTLQMTETTRLVRHGESPSFVVRIVRQNNWAGPVRLVLDGLPPGVIAGFLPVNPTPDPTSDLRLVIPASTAPGDYTLRITGTAGGSGTEVTRQVSLLLRIRGTEGVALVVASGGDVGIGQTARIGEIEATVVNGDGPVTLSAEGLPPGVALAVGQNPLIGRTLLSATVAIGVPTGVVTFTIVGTTPNASTRVAASLRVVASTTPTLRYAVTPVVSGPGETPGYGLSAATASATIARGSAAQIFFTIVPRGGFSQPIDFTVSGLPASAIGSLEPTATPNVLRLTVTVPATQPVGTSTMVITGLSGSLSAAIAVALTVV
jgi:hypothetical protein